MTEQSETIKHILDIVSVTAAIGSFLDILTPVFGLIGAVWTLMRIAEMVTGKPFSELIRKKKADDAKLK
tara:strand:+ start:512 stop:718 length:207 start_codon:yes stop_codon:yes gene_type:complete